VPILVKVLKFVLFYFLLWPVFRLLRNNSAEASWVIGGHAGRAYTDNSASLHKYIVQHTEQPIIWITNNKVVFDQLQKQKGIVLMRDSIQARLAILHAPVLIRSHGYADLDRYLGRLVKPEGLAIHLNHCLNLLKAGQMHSPMVERMTQKQKKRVQSKIFDFDYLLASSPLEQGNFRLSIPFRSNRIVLGGGAHLDDLKQHSGLKASKHLLYFPTFRDKEISSMKTVDEIVQELVSNPKLKSWLKESGYKLSICSHINSKSRLDVDGRDDVFALIGIENLTEELARCDLLISDYSGTIADALYMEKPVLFFPFDLKPYLECRHLYVDYGEFVFGDIVTTTNELVDNLVNLKWQDESAYKDIRARHRREMFYYTESCYSERSYRAICDLKDGVNPENIR
jgi:CDP-glycerol glycerophosphotransferase (TagB/SpsB family)